MNEILLIIVGALMSIIIAFVTFFWNKVLMNKNEDRVDLRNVNKIKDARLLNISEDYRKNCLTLMKKFDELSMPDKLSDFSLDDMGVVKDLMVLNSMLKQQIDYYVPKVKEIDINKNFNKMFNQLKNSEKMFNQLKTSEGITSQKSHDELKIVYIKIGKDNIEKAKEITQQIIELTIVVEDNLTYNIKDKHS